jgi:hypothetical protein
VQVKMSNALMVRKYHLPLLLPLFNRLAMNAADGQAIQYPDFGLSRSRTTCMASLISGAMCWADLTLRSARLRRAAFCFEIFLVQYKRRPGLL